MENYRMTNAEQGLLNEEGASYVSRLEERLIDFAVSVCSIAEGLPSNRIGNHVSKQLIRGATSPAPNYGEAQSAESRRDFIHKMKVCLKELRETHIWLKFIERMGLHSGDALSLAMKESDELIAIFVRSILTAQQNAKRATASRQAKHTF